MKMPESQNADNLEDKETTEYLKQQRNNSLLRKYDIPLCHLDYGYIEKCTNPREMEKIIMVLRSGQEGVYPDLTKKAEERLTMLKPKSKLLRHDEPLLSSSMLDPAVRTNLVEEMANWETDVKSIEGDILEACKDMKTKGRHGLPGIRNYTKCNQQPAKKKNPERIASSDYASWDKYDPDTELLKMEIKEEKDRETAKAEERKKELELARLGCTGDAVDGLSTAERTVLAEQERIRGNDSFRAAEYKVALQQYSNSIQLLPTIPAYNNRALTNIKLKKFDAAIEDCDEVLLLDVENIKALLRKADALQSTGKNTKAMEYFEKVIRLDPNNTTAQKGAAECAGFVEPSKSVRMKIQDIQPSNKIVELPDEPSKNKTPENTNVVKSKPSKPTNSYKKIEMGSQMQPRKLRTCLVPIPSTSSYNGAPVREVQVGFDQSENNVDKSIVHGKALPVTEVIVLDDEKENLKRRGRKCVEILEQKLSDDEDKENERIIKSRSIFSVSNNFFKLRRKCDRGGCGERGIKIKDWDNDKSTPKIQLPSGGIKIFDTTRRSCNDRFREDSNPTVNRSFAEVENLYINKPIEIIENSTTQVEIIESDVKNKTNDSKIELVNSIEVRNERSLSPDDDDDVVIQSALSKTETLEEMTFAERDNVSLIEGRNNETFSRDPNHFDSYQPAEISEIADEDHGLKLCNGFSEEQHSKLKPKEHEVDKNVEKSTTLQKKSDNASDNYKITTPYGFITYWETIRGDEDMSIRSGLMRQIKPRDLSKIVGNRLDGPMLTGFLRCLLIHFTPEDGSRASYILEMLVAITKLARFSVIYMFLDKEDLTRVRKLIEYIQKFGIEIPKEISKNLNI